MPSFSQRSKDRLATCDPRLREICEEAIKYYDFTVLCGHRGEADQNAAVAAGRSRVRWPNGKHNSMPSRAVDLAPWHTGQPHIRWGDTEAFFEMATYILAAAARLGYRLKWGGHWRSFRDMPHFEVIE